jgi:hypothetical protein
MQALTLTEKIEARRGRVTGNSSPLRDIAHKLETLEQPVEPEGRFSFSMSDPSRQRRSVHAWGRSVTQALSDGPKIPAGSIPAASAPKKSTGFRFAKPAQIGPGRRVSLRETLTK